MDDPGAGSHDLYQNISRNILLYISSIAAVLGKFVYNVFVS